MSDATYASNVAQTRVRLGAELLDKHEPGWHRRINLETLSLCSYTNCILGQLFYEFNKGMHALEQAIGTELIEWRVGFDINPREDICDEDVKEKPYDLLDKWWRVVVDERLTYDRPHLHEQA